jgi:hypothetical protein
VPSHQSDHDLKEIFGEMKYYGASCACLTQLGCSIMHIKQASHQLKKAMKIETEM